MRTNFTVILVMILLSLGATAYSETGNASLNSNVSAIQPAYDSNVAKEVIADAPWLITTDTIPIMIMIRDADAADYDLGNVEVYQDSNCDRSNSLNGDVLLYNETRWNGQTINDNYFNLYRKGDWYGIIELNNSFGLNGLTCFHVIIRDIGGILDTDDDTHAFFNVTITDTRVPRSNNWYCGDTHYHT